MQRFLPWTILHSEALDISFLQSLPLLELAIAGAAVFLITLLVRWLLFRFVPPLMEKHSPLWSDIMARWRVLDYLYLSVPGFLVASTVQVTELFGPTFSIFVVKAALIYGIVMLTLAVISALRAYNDFYNQRYEFAREVPIKTVVQAVGALVVIFAILTIIAVVLEVPLLALAGVMAAIAGIAYYFFREPLLGFSASLQLSANHMLGIGDWIEMKGYGADGNVEDINLTATKIRNWDNSIVTIPTYMLIKEPFQNWESMQEKEARRVLRPLSIDQRSIAFASAEERAAKTAVIETLYNNLAAETQQNSGLLGARPQELQARSELTNLELFMAYATMIVAGHPQTRADYSIYVRQQAPSPQGLPVELFFFTRATDFVPYHAVQREIFSHLLAILPDFDLRPYQVISNA